MIRASQILTGLLGVVALAAGAAAEPLTLSIPIACEPGKTCFIQNYVDLDPAAGVRDFACGSATYDGHNGVDFRVLSAAATATGVAVLAAADGVVTGMRDGVTDIFLREAKAEDLKGRECGNGVIINHGGGWETQYCHMKSGSLRVAKDQKVTRGDRLGDVGFSGRAEFAHVHLSVRHNDKIVDPFYPEASAGACQVNVRSAGLWQPDVAAKLPYKSGQIVGAGFAGAPPDRDALEVDHNKVDPVTARAPALLFYGRLINVMAGDRVRVIINGPGGSFSEELSLPLERNKATFLSYAGKKRTDRPWPAGRYEGRIELVREGAVIATKLGETIIAPETATPASTHPGAAK